MKTKSKKKTAEQRRAASALEAYGIVHYLMTQQKCPVMLGGKLAFVKCPGVSKEAFNLAIDKLVVENLCHIVAKMRGEPKAPNAPH